MTTTALIRYTFADGTAGTAASFTDLPEPPPGYVWRRTGATWRQAPPRWFAMTDTEKCVPLGEHADFSGASDAAEQCGRPVHWIFDESGLRKFAAEIQSALNPADDSPEAPATQPAEPFTVQGRYWTDRNGNTYSAVTISQGAAALWASGPLYSRTAWRHAARDRLTTRGIDPERARRIVADATETEVRRKRDL